MEDRLRGSTAEGLLGVGTLLYGLRPAGDGAYEAAAWIAVLFFPILPRSRWTLRAPASDQPIERLVWEPRGFEFVRTERRAIGAADMLRTWGKALLVLAVAVAPAWWTFENIEQTGVLPA